MNYYLLKSLFLLCVFLYSSGTVFAQNERAETRIDSIIKQYSMVGVAVVVVKKGDLIYNQSFGMKNKEKGTALSNTDIVRIASISKGF